MWPRPESNQIHSNFSAGCCQCTTRPKHSRSRDRTRGTQRNAGDVTTTPNGILILFRLWGGFQLCAQSFRGESSDKVIKSRTENQSDERLLPAGL